MKFVIIEVAKALAVIVVSTVVFLALHPNATSSMSDEATASLMR